MRKHVGGYFMMATFALFAVSIGIDGVALYMPKWQVIKDQGLSRGLWQECIEGKRKYECSTTERTIIDKLVIALLILSAVCKLPPLLLSLFKSWRFENCRLPLTVFTGLADAWTIVAVSAYAASPPDMHGTLSPSFGLSFELTVGNAVITFLLTIACWHAFLTKELLDNAPKPPTGMVKNGGSADHVRIMF